MEYAKKMVVVPQELIERLQTGEDGRRSDNSLDAEMHHILNDKRIDDGEKWKQYQQVLQRFLHFSASKREPINLPVVETEIGKTQERMHRTASALVDELVDTFPKIYKGDARNLLRAMARTGDLVSWDGEGAVYVRNVKIPNSNIVDIMHNIVRVRKVDRLPVGWREVMGALKEMNIPTEYINNPTALQMLGRERGDTSVPVSPGSVMYSAPPTHRRLRRSEDAPSPVQRWEPYTP